MAARETIRGGMAAKDGRDIAYALHRGGNGGSIVAVQGAGSEDVWERQMPLTERYSILCYRGSAYDEENARILQGLCKDFRIVMPHMVGHSWGTQTCLEYCRIAESGYSPSTLTLITPVRQDWSGITIFTRTRILLQSTGDSECDVRLLSFVRSRSGLPAKSRVELCRGHFPFQDDAVSFNRKLVDFLENRQ